MSQSMNVSMTRKEAREYNLARERTNEREAYKRERHAHNLLCTCKRCDPSIITKWRRIKVGEL